MCVRERGKQVTQKSWPWEERLQILSLYFSLVFLFGLKRGPGVSVEGPRRDLHSVHEEFFVVLRVCFVLPSVKRVSQSFEMGRETCGHSFIITDKTGRQKKKKNKNKRKKKKREENLNARKNVRVVFLRRRSLLRLSLCVMQEIVFTSIQHRGTFSRRTRGRR